MRLARVYAPVAGSPCIPITQAAQMLGPLFAGIIDASIHSIASRSVQQ
jgi:hypothetical protein